MAAKAEHVEECVPYPMFVRLQGARVVCVGGGAVAARKVDSLLEYGADVVVIAPEACDRLRALADEGAIAWERRAYGAGDFDGARLAIVATSNRTVNEAASAEADEKNILLNVVDDPEMCSFLVPSVVRRGQLQVAISTNGAAPSVAREVRRDLEQRFPAWWEAYIDLLAELRMLVKCRVHGSSDRRAVIFEKIRSSDIGDRIARGDTITAEQAYQEIVAPLVEELEAS